MIVSLSVLGADVGSIERADLFCYVIYDLETSAILCSLFAGDMFQRFSFKRQG
ncbi:hypothetical protein N040_23875 [Serratia marcescens EGD-HP20]|nr:hypothetical protein N040_23875 [Serratia marcescens EGD-HP20]